ncbi:MAG TPA: PAS domain S-box protein [Verrucomicrobiae bacterium]
MFRQLSIRNKLALVLWGAALTAFVLAIVSLPIIEKLTLRQRVESVLDPYVRLVSVGAEPAVTFGDAERAKEILNSLRGNPEIEVAEILLDNGTLLASYRRQADAEVTPFQARPDGIYLGNNSAELQRQLAGNARLRLIIGLAELKRVPRLTLWAFGLGLLVLLLVTSFLLMALERAIVRPMTALVEAAEQVRTRGDYARRVPATGADEVARLGRSFNAMMTAVEERENELRRLNQFHQTVLNNAAYGIVSTTANGVVTSFNRAAEQLLGYAAAELVGKQTPALWHDAAEVSVRAEALSRELGEKIPPGFETFVAPARRGLPSEQEWTFIRKDGSRVPVLVSVTALRDEQGQITGFVGLTYDITERKAAQETLRKVNEELERRVAERTNDLQVKSVELKDSQRALMNLVEDLNEKASALETANNELAAVNKELESFSYSVSHDLRAPLRAIDGFSRILLEDYDTKLDDDGRDNLRRVCAASQRMGRLIDDLLALSRVTRSEMHRGPVALSDIAGQILEELKDGDPARQVELLIQPALIAEGDPILLRAVLENLLGNSWKFTSKKASARIEFGRTQRRNEPAYFVRDNGAGFDMTYANKLFGAFQRLHTAADFPGTGIGLATVQRIIHRHGGWIEAESAVGQGATFYFTVPGSRLNGACVAEANTAAASASGEKPDERT